MTNDKFQSLPEKIKEWLSSTEAFYTTEEIIQKFNIEFEKETVIPELVFRLCVKDLDPLDFIYELSQKLGAEFNQAKTIAEEIEEKILKPIKFDLRKDTDIDIKQIYLGKPGSRISKEPASLTPSAMPYAPIQKSFRDFIPRKPGEAPIPQPPSKKEGATVNLQTFEIEHKDINSKRSDLLGEVRPPNSEPAVPFMLHQEDGTSTTLPTNREKPAPKFSIKPELEIKVQDYYQNPTEQKKAPTQVKIETPQDAANNSSTPRVVHYGGFRTPISNLGYAQNTATAKENTVDLRKFSKPESK